MDAELLRTYDGLAEYLEEPIREIVPAIWRMPFVVDTGYACSGHILSQRERSIGEFSRRFGWYPHRAILEIAFSKDAELVGARDAFRRDLAAVCVSELGIDLRFDDVYSYDRDTLPYSRVPGDNFYESYNANTPEDIELNKSEASVELMEGMLTSFWEQVAEVVLRHNPQAEIGPIKGKSFREVINWASWRGIFFDRPTKPSA